MRSKKPHWDLAVVKSLNAAGKLILTKTKAQSSFTDAAAAMNAAKTLVDQLTDRQFAETLVQLDICDVYGVQFQGCGWYLKLTIDELLVVVSLHPLQWSLRTNGGIVAPPPTTANGREAKDKPDEMP